MISTARHLKRSLFLSLPGLLGLFLSFENIFGVEKNIVKKPQQILQSLFKERAIEKRFSTPLKINMPAPLLVRNILKNRSPKKALTDMTEDQNDQIPKLLLKWGSGGQRARFFKDNEVKTFFSNLFRQVIRLGKQEQLSLSLNTTDLFHGHLVLLNEGTRDLIIIFHAQEYPHDLPFTQHKSIEAVRTYKKTLKGKKFGHKTISFQRRNFIWSLLF